MPDKDSDLSKRLSSLRSELGSGEKQSKDDDQKGGPSGQTATAWGMAIRMLSDLIAGVAVGVFLGWMIDTLAGSSPFGLILLTLAGFAAGIRNLLRHARGS